MTGSKIIFIIIRSIVFLSIFLCVMIVSSCSLPPVAQTVVSVEQAASTDVLSSGSDKRLSFDDIIKLKKLKVGNEMVLENIKNHGINFIPTEENYDRLRDLGADGNLLQGIYEAALKITKIKKENHKPASSDKTLSVQAQSSGDVVATVNGVKIYRKDLDRTFNAHVNQTQNAGNNLPPEEVQQLQQIILDRLIESELLCQKGKELNITAPDKEVLSRIEQFKKQFPSEAEFEAKLKENQISLEDLKNELRKNMIISKVIQQQMANQAASDSANSDEELKKYYDAHKDQFKQEEMVQASHILVKVEKDADEATKKAAKEKIAGLLKKVKAGEDFATLAKENSDCPSSQNGGDLGFFTSKQMVPEFSQAAFSLKVGEVSDIVETPFGYHIIKVTNTKHEADTSFEESKARIKQYLSKKQKSDTVRNYIQSLREQADIRNFFPRK